MEILSPKKYMKVKLLKIKSYNNCNQEEIKSQSFNLLSPQQQILNLKLDSLKDVYNRDKSILSYKSLRYIPKKLSQINFEELPNSMMDNISSTKITNNFQINFNSKFNRLIKRLKPESGHNLKLKQNLNFTGIKFRNEYQVKYDSIIDEFKKLKMKSENISEINKYNYSDYWEKVQNCLKNHSFLLFGSIKNFEKEESKALILNIEEYNLNINKILSILLSELNEKTENYYNIVKINRDLENEINRNNIEIKRLKKLLNNPKIKKLYSNKHMAEQHIEKVRLSFLKEKNDHIILINELKKEIKNLYKFLNKNREYYEKYIQDELEIKEMKSEKKETKSKYKKEIMKLNEQIKFDKIDIDNLNEKIEELNIGIKEKQNDEQNRLNYRLQIKNLERQNMKLYENYLMVKEELNSYLYLGIKNKNINI